MSGEESLDRLEKVADDVAEAVGASVDVAQAPDGSWVASIEPQGEAHGDWAVKGSGPTKAHALSRLIKNARNEGIAS